MSSTNEYSTRYSEVHDEFEYVTDFRAQSTTNKQGSGDLLTVAPEGFNPGLDYEYAEDYAAGAASLQELLEENVRASIDNSFSVYRLQLDAGVAREQARNVLPLATYTEMYWKIDLHNLFHYLSLRLDPHAQKEIREFAQAMYDVVKDWVPVAAEAFEDYRLNGASFSAQELNVINTIAHIWAEEMRAKGSSQSDSEMLLNLSGIHGLSNKREQQELLTKLGLT
jgi:thymidylate synthase (FAD)